MVVLVNRESSFSHHFFQVPVSALLAQLPAQAKQDDLQFKMLALEEFGLTLTNRVPSTNG